MLLFVNMLWVVLLAVIGFVFVFANGHDHVQPILIEPHYLSRANKDSSLPKVIDIGPLVSQIASMERVHVSSSTSHPMQQFTTPPHENRVSIPPHSTQTKNVETSSSAINRSTVLPSKTTTPKKVIIASKIETTTVIDDDTNATDLDSNLDRMDLIGRNDEDDESAASAFSARNSIMLAIAGSLFGGLCYF